jgi:serine protease
MRLRAPFALALALAFLAACGDSPTGSASGPGTVLTPGQPRFVSGGQNTSRTFTVEVPPGTGTLRIQLTEGTGDADLVVRFGAPPAAGFYDCISEAFENAEECLFDVPDPGTWYITVVGYDDYRDARLLATLGAQAGATSLVSGVAVTGISGATDSFRMFSIAVPAGATALEVTLDGPNGDADLYLRHATFPLLNDYDCASFEPASVEHCLVPGPAAGTWYVRIEGYLAYTGATLTATVSTP